jgi:hypothetical protein
MAWAFSDHRESPRVGACCGLNNAENPHGTGIVALWRIEGPGRGDARERARRGIEFSAK